MGENKKNNKKIEVSNKEVLKFFWKTILFKKYHIFGIFLLVILSNISFAFYPIFIKNITNLISAGNFDINGVLIWKNFYLLFGTVCFSLIIWRVIEYLMMVELTLNSKVFSDSFKYLNKHSYSFFSNSQSGSLIKRINRLPYSFEAFIDLMVFNFFPALTSFVFLFVVLYYQNLTLFFVFFIFLFLFVLVTFLFQKWLVKYNKIWTEKDSKVSGVLGDAVINNFNISIFGAFNKEKKVFDKNLENRKKAGKKWWLRFNLMSATQWFMIFMFDMVILFFTLKLVLGGSMTVGTFVMINLFVNQIVPKLLGLGQLFKNLYRIFADASEALEILKTPHEITDIKNARDLEVKKGEIEFKDVDFKYKDGTKVFEKFNLKIKPGEKVALVGESGAGKTSIVQLIFRFFDIQGGKILIDGQNISKVKQDSLRRNVSLVPQDPILFHRSLTENMKYGNENISEEKFLEISKKTHCHDFISELEKGYDTLVGERGIKLSGGQRQRVSIARAIIENSKIFILDEATSALDSESEKKVQEALDIAMKGKTSIVIAHRLSTIMKMDRIIVLEKGKILEEGTHDELLKKSGSKYKKLWEIQSGSFEK